MNNTTKLITIVTSIVAGISFSALQGGVLRTYARTLQAQYAIWRNQTRQSKLVEDFAAGKFSAEERQPFYRNALVGGVAAEQPYTLPQAGKLEDIRQSSYWISDIQNSVACSYLYRNIHINSSFACLRDESGQEIAWLPCQLKYLVCRPNKNKPDAWYGFMMAKIEKANFWFKHYADLHNAGFCEELLLQKALSSLKKHKVDIATTSFWPSQTLPAEYNLYDRAGFATGPYGASKMLRQMHYADGSRVDLEPYLPATFEK